jgi:hypothetical protein
MHLEQANKAIKQAWIAGLVSAVLSIFVAVFLMANSGGSLMGFVDVAIMVVLSIGVYKKSRVAATLLFVIFVASKVWLIVTTGNFTGGILAAVFAVFFFQGMRGTFAYHKHQKMWGAAE